MLDQQRLAILGLGKIGGTLAGALLEQGVIAPEQLRGTTGHPESAQAAGARYGITVDCDNAGAVRASDLVILAVKPQRMPAILAEIRPAVRPEQLFITIAAAIQTGYVEKQLGQEISVIRGMPNMPCLVQAGMTVLCPGRRVSQEQLTLAQQIFAAVGRVALLDREELMDAVTGLSGSGPAYAYVIIEALAEGGVKAGLSRRLATTLAAQSLLGAAKMVLETGEHPAKLKDFVTTPAGTTMDGIMALEEGGIRVTLIRTVLAATRKSEELSRQTGQSELDP
ncbi:MAG TPA: pyrroline-5-carboxylate reductase [Candidatus Fraserbacteria bacterium]|nr:pyrroline-5-carboxylate reductase [Candidatus Fraserbacteria bacterium]